MREFFLFMRHILTLLHFVRGVLLSLLLVLFVLALMISNIESMPLSDAIYFISITALTVGYGDITPTSGVAQTISVLSGIVGVIFVGILVAVSVRALEHAVREKGLEEQANLTRKNGS